MDKQYTYWLPDEKGNKKEYQTNENTLIIIGANGSGKSKLGAWIEQQDFRGVHRIGAQRNLNFQENTPMKNYAEAINDVFYGTNESGRVQHGDKGYRWDWGKYTTHLIDDFDNVLAALIAKDNNTKHNYFELCKQAEKNGQQKPNVPDTLFDTLQRIWKSVFPQRDLSLNDSRFIASIVKNGINKTYSANQMSDGERAVLYLSSQVLCVPDNKTLIIDEPEVHLHRSIMNRLWSALERSRPDCFFVYITHDTQFAAAHRQAEKIWIKAFDGVHWDLKKLEQNELPEELLLDILGCRKPVLFVEGGQNSYDAQLYSELYPSYYVVPCGSCTQVIQRTKAFRENQSLHEYDVYGLIDRDYRSDYEIEQYKKDKIFTLGVAEVENLFIIEELIRFMATHMGKNADEVFTAVKSTVTERYKSQVNKQILQSVVAEIKYRLNCAEISKRGEEEAKASLDSLYSDIEYDKIKEEQNEKFNAPLVSKDYQKIIQVFNEKNIAKSIGRFFSISNNDYCATVVALLQGSMHDEICGAISSYLPPEIPRS